MNNWLVLGGVSGLLYWLASLEAPDMGGILFRQDDLGNTVFTPYNIVLQLMAPFKYSYYWNTRLIMNNWIVALSSGVALGFGLSMFTK